MKKAFTLIELVVAVALLAMVFFFAGMIFKVSVNAYRTAGANAEIIQKLRAITDQLNTDFKGIRTDAPLLLWFHQDSHQTDPNRYDQIMLFADGDFQSTQLYKSGNNGVPDPDGERLITGNVARIYYGQARSLDPADNTMKDPYDLEGKDRLLARRRHILTADPCLAEWPDANMTDFDETTHGYKKNERYEHDSLSLAQWKTVEGDDYRNEIIPTCFDEDSRSPIDMRDPNTFHKLMCEGVGSFTIQWAYWDSGDDRFYWFPSNDPDGDGSNIDSHFDDIAGDDEFGVFFNIPNGSHFEKWYPIDDVIFAGKDFSSYPKALKFTFRLYDSRGIIEENGRAGRTFTHIVYLGN